MQSCYVCTYLCVNVFACIFMCVGDDLHVKARSKVGLTWVNVAIGVEMPHID